MSKITLNNQQSWDEKWPEIFDHYQQDLRHAYYIRALKNPNEHKLLEIGAGSFRDMAQLCRWGIDCHGVDYSAEAVKLAQKQFPKLAHKISQMDAFHYTFGDASFDLTYHNGVWVLFSDDDIKKLALEQARISKYRMIATVHNAHNQGFVSYFERMAQNDPLYQIRFFTVDEMRAHLSAVSSRITIVPVGKGKKRHEDWLIKKGLGSPSILRPFFNLTGQTFLKQSERLLCIAEL